MIFQNLGATFAPSDVLTPALMPDAQWSASLEAVAPGVTGLVAENATPGESWVDTLGRLLPVIASTYQQKQLLDVQVERARNGLPPLNASQYAPGVAVGLNTDTQKLLIGIAVALLVGLWLMKRRG